MQRDPARHAHILTGDLNVITISLLAGFDRRAGPACVAYCSNLYLAREGPAKEEQRGASALLDAAQASQQGRKRKSPKEAMFGWGKGQRDRRPRESLGI
jgi:hypothetical protein